VAGLVDLCPPVWSHRLVPEFSDRFAWDKTSAQKYFFSFEKWIFLVSALSNLFFFATQSDRSYFRQTNSSSCHFGVYGIAF
jgi:hypothetical protein